MSESTGQDRGPSCPYCDAGRVERYEHPASLAPDSPKRAIEGLICPECGAASFSSPRGFEATYDGDSDYFDVYHRSSSASFSCISVADDSYREAVWYLAALERAVSLVESEAQGAQKGRVD